MDFYVQVHRRLSSNDVKNELKLIFGDVDGISGIVLLQEPVNFIRFYNVTEKSGTFLGNNYAGGGSYLNKELHRLYAIFRKHVVKKLHGIKHPESTFVYKKSAWSNSHLVTWVPHIAKAVTSFPSF